MSVVKIVPMPGISVPGAIGAQGPTGPQGEPGQDIVQESDTWTPVVSGTGFVQSSNPATGTYNRIVDLVFVNLNVPFSNVTNFGTGQYSVTLPFNSVRHADLIGGSLHDTSTERYYTIKGHIEANSNQMTLWFISGTGLDNAVDYNSPFLIATADLFHMSFVYEAVPAA